MDIFAGPGGLGEGFSAYERSDGNRPFRIALSIEKDQAAHATLTLRSFYRQFEPDDVPMAYYAHLRGELSKDELFRQNVAAANAVQADAWLCELGVMDDGEVDRRVAAAVRDSDHWALIGGPPCQAYSLVGRSRMQGADPDKFARDPRHFLYRQYLRLLARHRPPVFVMENVKGLLSATHDGSNMFQRILHDLGDPASSVRGRRSPGLHYRLHALSVPERDARIESTYSPDDFVLRAEEYGIPQARHRIIIVGVRDDIPTRPPALVPKNRQTSIGDVLFDLPRLRSRISRGADSKDEWNLAIRECAAALRKTTTNQALRRYLGGLNIERDAPVASGAEFIFWKKRPKYRNDWYIDPKLRGVCNHVSRSHLRSDIERYFFAAAFAAAGESKSPRLSDFPAFLLPNHQNVQQAIEGTMFCDRFRVQVADRPSTTVTSHISKDGHYYIHPDPLQARSLTVREAARLQTFPDSYLFCGPRTSQYQQVGNAVPPLLGCEIAAVVDRVLGGE